MAYRFATKPSPTEPSELDNFGNIRTSGSRQPLGGSPGNGFQTIDVTATPVTSPVTVASGTPQLINVPLNAVTMTINTATAINMSEVVGSASFFTIPAGVPMTIDVANQATLYLTSATSSVVSFYFAII